MTPHQHKGHARERDLPREIYFSETYFSLPVLLSQSLQIWNIHKLTPTSILEIGPGNGFVSSFLRSAGMDVVTVDINPALKPDICAPLSELPEHLNRKFDLVVCCEVLEHMPLSDLDANLDILRATGDRLFLTLPNIRHSIGFGGLVGVPVIGQRLMDAFFNVPLKRELPTMHFWEVGYNRDCTQSNIVGRLKKRYRTVQSSKFALVPYHYSFIAE